ncbi:MAG: class I SAM-dependent methyltransferase [Candidatus Zambryskibacteria bacterium]
MNTKDKKIIIERYKNRFKEHGINVKALASGNTERQRMRFKVLSEVGNLEDQIILDIGCGFGDFYAYLKEQGIKAKYVGLDICPPFIDVCKERFPEARFEVGDIENSVPKGKFDYIISSQTFNNKLQFGDNEKVIRNIIKKGYKICEKGMAIDMLTKYVDFEEPHLHYYSPEEIFTFCKKLTKRVTLRHDYPLYEFMIYLYKDFKGWKS